jgi:adenosine deaminase
MDITHEYVRAALDYRLKYSDLEQLARTGLEHSFLPGLSLWAAQWELERRLRAFAARF